MVQKERDCSECRTSISDFVFFYGVRKGNEICFLLFFFFFPFLKNKIKDVFTKLDERAEEMSRYNVIMCLCSVPTMDNGYDE
jgi:hypothetical protein